METTYVFAQHAARAGRPVPVDDDTGWPVDPETGELSDDVIEVELTREEAARWRERGGSFGHRVAESILKTLGIDEDEDEGEEDNEEEEKTL